MALNRNWNTFALEAQEKKHSGTLCLLVVCTHLVRQFSVTVCVSKIFLLLWLAEVEHDTRSLQLLHEVRALAERDSLSVTLSYS